MTIRAISTGRHPACDKNAGFTLLELLAAIFVLGFVAVMLSQGLTLGLQATRLVAGERKEDALAVEQALRRMIKLADPGVYPEPATLRGTASTLTMTTELPSGGTGPLQRAEIVLSAAQGRLMLRWRPRQHAEWFASGPAWTDSVVAEHIERIELSYFGRGGSAAWSSSWTADQLPRFVQMKIVAHGEVWRQWPPILVAPVRDAMEE